MVYFKYLRKQKQKQQRKCLECHCCLSAAVSWWRHFFLCPFREGDLVGWEIFYGCATC